MITKMNKINEGFVAGVGFSKTSGFAIGDMTVGLRKNPKLLDAFKDGRKDILFNGKPESQSITIFPANEDAMTIVSAFYRGTDAADRRSHCFCHGMIVDNRIFSEEILPILNTERFASQFLTSMQEAGELGDCDVLRFHSVGDEEDITEAESMNVDTISGSEQAITDESKDELRRLFAFSLKTAVKGGYYIVQIGEKDRKSFQKSVYEMLPSPFRYRVESCSCGEYGKMMNLLIAADEPYHTRDGYKKLTLNQILSADITEKMEKYPTIYEIVADAEERKAFYAYLEESDTLIWIGRKFGVQTIEQQLEKKAWNFRKSRDKQVSQDEIGTTYAPSPPIDTKDSDIIPVHLGDMTLRRDSIYAYDYDKYNNLAEAGTFEEARNLLPDMRLKDLVDDYIGNGTLEYYTELRNSMFGEPIGRRLREIQRRRLRDRLIIKSKEAAGITSGEDCVKRYAKLVMLAYQMTAEEFVSYQTSHIEDEVIYGPYWYEEIRRFLRENFRGMNKLRGALTKICNPFA